MTGLMGDQAQQVKGVGVGRMIQQYLTIERLGLRHAAGAILQHGVKELVVIHFPEGCFARTRDGKDHWQLSCFMEYCAPRCRTAACIASQLT